MKHKTKKLTLGRETLRRLADLDLERAGGGLTPGTCQGTRCDTCFSILPNCTEACDTLHDSCGC